ncbi:hypothetical protein [Streptomyces albogriseolus]
MDDADDMGDADDMDDMDVMDDMDTGPPPGTRERLAHPTMKPPTESRRGL